MFKFLEDGLESLLNGEAGLEEEVVGGVMVWSPSKPAHQAAEPHFSLDPVTDDGGGSWLEIEKPRAAESMHTDCPFLFRLWPNVNFEREGDARAHLHTHIHTHTHIVQPKSNFKNKARRVT